MSRGHHSSEAYLQEIFKAAGTPDAVQRNIDTIVKLEEAFLQERSLFDRIADGIVALAGSMTFIGLHVVWFGLWVVLNNGQWKHIRPFDPYPYQLLVLAVSLEAIFLSTFVLMSQNRMGRRADQRAHLDLQINILAEREMTLVLQMLQKIGAHVGLDTQVANPEVRELAHETPLEAMADELKKKLPNQ